jgi:transcriptional regulator GlxA family with amidase domain
MSKETAVKYLNSYTITINNSEESARIKQVFAYMMQNFQQEIHLEQVASLVNMSESAFSRYFKHRTRETFSHILTEIRIEYACKMLQENDISIADICFESGFQNVSNFNRQFKKMKKMTPLNYRQLFH